MSSRAAQLVTDGIRRRGRRIVLRTMQPDGQPPSPPNAVDLVVGEALNPGAAVLDIISDVADGQIRPGDILAVGGQKLVVTNTTVATPASSIFAGVTFTPPLVTAIAAGALITPTWMADLPVYAMVNAYPLALVDGKMVLSRDLRVKIGNFLLPGPIMPGKHVLVIDGDIRTVVDASPVYERADVVSWDVHAR